MGENYAKYPEGMYVLEVKSQDFCSIANKPVFRLTCRIVSDGGGQPVGQGGDIELLNWLHTDVSAEITIENLGKAFGWNSGSFADLDMSNGGGTNFVTMRFDAINKHFTNKNGKTNDSFKFAMTSAGGSTDVGDPSIAKKADTLYGAALKKRPSAVAPPQDDPVKKVAESTVVPATAEADDEVPF
jgi:hypothetical protein